MKTDKYLTFLGIIPFLFLLILSFYHFETIGYISELFYAYSAVIISFIAGTHWGICLHSKDGNKRILLESNLITLIAWFSLFYLGLITELIMIGCFLYLLYVEHRLKGMALLVRYISVSDCMQLLPSPSFKYCFT